MSRTRLLLMLGAALPLAACGGASDPASPGQGGVVVVPAPAPTPTPGGSVAQPNTPQNAVNTGSGNLVTADQIIALVNAGTNNVLTGSNAIATGALAPAPGTPAANATVFNVAAVDPFFTQTNYIGAINPAGDTWYQGWTCNSSTALLNPQTPGSTCSNSLNRSTAAPAASVCPAGTTALTGTGADLGIIPGPANGYRICRLPATITGTLDLPRVDGVAYQMNGIVNVGVDRGANGTGGTAGTLNIAPGVIIVANSNDPANDYLVVNRGSQINAIGTPTNPIIFTSQQNLNAAATSDATQGQWGGVILAGRAAIVTTSCSNPSAAAPCENTVEGTSPQVRYGGFTSNDSSGTMRYVQIRFSGTEISPGQELQGLTTAGTGSGTTLEFIQSHNSSDDGIEVFGGTQNFRNIVITGADDDGFDVDVGWRGKVQFLLVVQKVFGATTDSFATEIDSNGNEDFLPRTYGQLANFTFIQTAAAPAAIRLRGGADFSFYNGIVKAVGPCLNVVATNSNDAAATGASTIRPANTTLQDLGPPEFRSVYFACGGN